MLPVTNVEYTAGSHIGWNAAYFPHEREIAYYLPNEASRMLTEYLNGFGESEMEVDGLLPLTGLRLPDSRKITSDGWMYHAEHSDGRITNHAIKYTSVPAREIPPEIMARWNEVDSDSEDELMNSIKGMGVG